MAGDLNLILQLGFAFALGMLIDTFVIRPLLLPAFAVLVRPRRGSDATDAPGE
jgi:RND superfamily putative drug exporter